MTHTDDDPLLSGPPVRWTSGRKRRALALVYDGRITRAAALELWGISEEEWMSWERRYERHGSLGLRATWVQRYRRTTLAIVTIIVVGSLVSTCLARPADAEIEERRRNDMIVRVAYDAGYQERIHQYDMELPDGLSDSMVLTRVEGPMTRIESVAVWLPDQQSWRVIARQDLLDRRRPLREPR